MTISATKYPELIQAIQNGFSFNLKTDLIGLRKVYAYPDQPCSELSGQWVIGQMQRKCQEQDLPFEKTSSKNRFYCKIGKIYGF